MACYLKQRQPLDKEIRNKLRAECWRTSIEGKVAATPNLHTSMVTFMGKLIKDPNRSIAKSLSSCQDKLLDITGPITKIMEMVKDAKRTGGRIDLEIISG